MHFLRRYGLAVIVTALVAVLVGRLWFAAVVPPSKPVTLGIGVWIWLIRHAEGGSVERIVKRARSARLESVIIGAPKQVTDPTTGQKTWVLGRYNSPAQFQSLVQALHTAGIKAIAWGYVTGGKPNLEADRAIAALQMGADGYIFNAEGEYKHRHRQAHILGGRVRQYVDTQSPTKVLAYSTFGRIGYVHFNGVPVEAFDRYCDYAMPQVYWRTFGTKSKPWKPEQAFTVCKAMWQQRRAKQPLQFRRPLIPTGHAYRAGITGVRPIPASEVATFLRLAKAYPGVNFWRWDYMGPSHWEAIRAASRLSPEPKASVVAQLIWVVLFSVWFAGVLIAYIEYGLYPAARIVPWRYLLLFSLTWPIIEVMRRLRHRP